MHSDNPQPLLSVVVPCYNEQEVLRASHQRLLAALEPLDLRLEIVYVDDGSTDGTEAVLRRIQATEARVRVLLFARNFGHQIASTAGIDYARGDAVVLIDADLQDPPEVIVQMVEQWREGYDVVYGRRTCRDGESAFKLVTASLFYRMINRLSDTPIPPDVGDFRLMDRKVVDALKQMPEHDRFIRGMVSWVGFRQIALPYERAKRFAGTSNYPVRKMLRLALDGILSFSLGPLRAASVLGLAAVASALAILFGGGVLWLVAGSPWLSSTGTILAAVLFLGGVQLVCTGILGEYVGRIYRESKRRPLYVVREELGAQSPAALEVRSADAA
ncbi:MAG: glycosyltransferase family 2 protein [Pirellulales bacterium]